MVRGIANSKIVFGDLILLLRYFFKLKVSTHPKPRKVKFEWQDSLIDWIPNHPFASYLINEINMILPAGEC